jgi:hypothetical protein
MLPTIESTARNPATSSAGRAEEEDASVLTGA